MSDTESQWYYAIGNEQKGPLTGDQIRAILTAGTITRETLVWSPAMTGWLPLGQTPLAAPPPFGAGPVPSFIPPPAQAFMAERMGATVRSVASSHAPFMAHPVEVAEIIALAC